MRGEGDLDHVNSRANVEKASASGLILKVEAVVFVDRLDMACGRVKVNTVVWGLDIWKEEVAFR